MAEADKGKGKGEELEMEEGGGKSKKLVMIIVGALLLVAAGGGAAFFFMGGDDSAQQQQATLGDDSEEAAAPAEQASAEQAVGVGTALYVAMPRPFVFNVPGSTRDRLVQIKVQLLVRGDAAEEEAKKHIPLIEGALLRTFSSTNADDLSTTAGKEALKVKALQDVQTTMVDITGKKIIERVLFTGFVMQ